MRSENPTSILVVDDEESVQRVLARVLERGGYTRVATTSSSEEARELLAAGGIDVVLTDMQMPGGSGLELLRHIHESLPQVATLVVTGDDSADLADAALDLGAYGYLVKPFRRSEVLINVRNATRRRDLELENREHRERLQVMVKERTEELWKMVQAVECREEDLRVSREDTIQRLSMAAEFRDDETACHIRRMSRYCGLLAAWVGIDRERCEMIRTASIMHDIGKIGIPDSILLKPGKLTPDEYAFIQQHAEFGHRILAGATSELLELAAVIALTHHEKWDGTGYPGGLEKEEIPLEGRIAAVADVFDALTTNRVYRKAFTLPEAIAIMKKGRGSHFDAELLDLFVAHLGEILVVAEEEEKLTSVA
jgi:putative two-component system response regulator